MNTQHAFFLNAGGRALSATLFLPEAAARGTVLFVPPFVEERKGALPVFVRTARALAERGVASLFFDFGGCGDSEGEFDAQPPDVFEADCEAVWAWLARAFPAAPRALLGLRCGALLAARLAARRPGAAACVLWAPVTGPDFLRQLFQRRMVNDMVAYGKAREGRAELEARLRRGETVDLDGYPVSGAFCEWLEGLRVSDHPNAQRPTLNAQRSTSNVQRSTFNAQPQDGPLTCPLLVCSGGHDVKTATACAAAVDIPETLALRYPPFWNTVGHVDLSALVAETADWLARRFPLGAQVPSPAAAPPFFVDRSLSDDKRQTINDIPIPATATADCRLVSIGAGIRAVFDAPEGTLHAGALFLHGWSGDRTGPHRLFTRFARQLARQGWLCLRPDFTGRGLSDGEAADASIAGMAENARAALDALRGRLPPGAPVAVVAICSGCKVAVTLAADRPEIARLVLWSAESMGGLRSSATGLRKTLSTLTTYARKLGRPETWRKLLSGKVQTGMVTKALVKQETRSAEEAAWEDSVLKRFRAFRNPVLFVFGGSDPDAPGSSRAYARYCRAHNIPHTVHTIAHAGHSYYGEAWTRELSDVSLDFLSR
jgi:alpha/beta superfamily hydrolase